MKYTKVPSDTFKKLVLNAGIICTSFTPSRGEVGTIIGATTGDISFASNPEYFDFGEDVNNVPANTKELKRLKSVDPVLSGTYVSVDANVINSMIGSATVSDNTIVPKDLGLEAFTDIWFVADYSDKNNDESAGVIAIHIFNALNTTGFSLKTSKDSKGNVSFEYHGHYSLKDIEKHPFEIYIKGGDSE